MRSKPSLFTYSTTLKSFSLKCVVPEFLNSGVTTFTRQLRKYFPTRRPSSQPPTSSGTRHTSRSKSRWQTAHLWVKEEVDLRRFLRAQQYFLAHDERVTDLLVEVVPAALFHVVDALPAIGAGVVSTMTVPLADFLANKPGDMVERIY